MTYVLELAKILKHIFKIHVQRLKDEHGKRTDREA